MGIVTALLVREYIDHLQDDAYVREIFASEGFAGVTAVLVDMLRCGDRDEAIAALLFIRDVVNYAMAPAYRTYLPRSGIFHVLRANLYAPDYIIRHNTVFTIGKLYYRPNARLLDAAFPVYLERDPLMLPSLLFELFWLTHHAGQWTYLSRVAASSHYLMRWSLLDESARPLPNPREEEPYERRRLARLLAQLAGDPHPLVRAEASYRRRMLPTRREYRLWRHGDRTALSRRIGQDEPELTFSSTCILFGNYLSVTKQRDYDLDTLDAFVRFRQTHPFPPEPAASESPQPDRPPASDLHAYAAAFDEWRGRNT